MPTPTNPLGVKGCGEAGCVGAMPAVANAIVDALSVYGVRHIEMPATPERVWRAIQAARPQRRRSRGGKRLAPRGTLRVPLALNAGAEEHAHSMTTPQILAFAIIGAMMALFVWGRLRYDLVAVLALLAAIVAGIVPYDKAFSGFSDDIVIIVACALLVSAAVQRSGMVETLMRPIAPYLTRTDGAGRRCWPAR